YADDTICHCVSKAQAEHLKEVLTRCLEQCRLKLNVEKTKIVQCPTSTRKKVVSLRLPLTFSAILSDVASHEIESKASASQTFFLPSAGNR
ncbi:MAG: reverse transcriptase domain-containing protein, partial [Prevotella sp.]|nr:reverse transcriptase domain-containing protein [Prevotella sp.]